MSIAIEITIQCVPITILLFLLDSPKKNQFTNQKPSFFSVLVPSFSFQTHLVCQVPPYINSEIIEPVTVQLYVTSSNKCSESHSFIYTPKGAFGSPGSLQALQSIHNKKGILNLIHYNSMDLYEILPKLIFSFFRKRKKKTNEKRFTREKEIDFLYLNLHTFNLKWEKRELDFKNKVFFLEKTKAENSLRMRQLQKKMIKIKF